MFQNRRILLNEEADGVMNPERALFQQDSMVVSRTGFASVPLSRRRMKKALCLPMVPLDSPSWTSHLHTHSARRGAGRDAETRRRDARDAPSPEEPVELTKSHICGVGMWEFQQPSASNQSGSCAPAKLLETSWSLGSGDVPSTAESMGPTSLHCSSSVHTSSDRKSVV